jgi:hypothetical protein
LLLPVAGITSSRRSAPGCVEHRQLALMISSTPAYTDSSGIPIARAALSKRSS